uniref:Uncharacterized protein n=1 Tax=viral metagenome TaxID=1070528 RepID=A0A6M3JWY6_9ZZZZ
MNNFRKELEALINKHSMEQTSNTPDFILAEYLVNCLKALDSATIQREKWYATPTNTDEIPPIRHPFR